MLQVHLPAYYCNIGYFLQNMKFNDGIGFSTGNIVNSLPYKPRESKIFQILVVIWQSQVYKMTASSRKF